VIRHNERCVLCGGERKRALLILFGVAILIDYSLASRGKMRIFWISANAKRKAMNDANVKGNFTFFFEN